MLKTIYQLSAEYKIPVTKLRRMCTNESFPVRESHPGELEEIIGILKRGRSLSVRQICSLIDDKLKLDSLGLRKRSAKTQIRLLGNIAADLMPTEMLPQKIIVEAANKDLKAADKFAAWISDIIPAEGCSYHYIAVRAVLSTDIKYREFMYENVARAILQARKSPFLENQSETDENGKTRFFRKSEKNILTYDL